MLKEESKVYCSDCGMEGTCNGCFKSFNVEEPQACLMCPHMFCRTCAPAALEEVLSRRDSQIPDIDRGEVWTCRGVHPVLAVFAAAGAREEECAALEQEAINARGKG